LKANQKRLIENSFYAVESDVWAGITAQLICRVVERE